MAKVMGITLGTLGLLGDGTAEIQINDAIQTVIEDLMDRGGDGEERRVVITIAFKNLENTIISQVTAEPKIPKRKAKMTACKPVISDEGVRTLLFQSECAENPEQSTLPFGEDD